MNLLFIYGPPASGKLTIAEELAKKTGYKVFHNHLTMDLAGEIYPEFDELRFKLVDKLRLDVFGYAANNDTSLISTFVYSGDEGDDKFITDTITVIAKSGGKVLFVELNAPNDVLLDRVGNETRQHFHKLKNPTILKKQLDNKLYDKSVPYSKIYRIDTSIITPTQAADQITRHYELI